VASGRPTEVNVTMPLGRYLYEWRYQTICSKSHALIFVFKDARHDDALTGFADGDEDCGGSPGQGAGLRNDG
jgi:hypothetical protein